MPIRLSDAVQSLLTAEADKVTSPSTQMALALSAKVQRTGTPIYAGTIYGAEKAKRRVVGRRQRAARKAHR
jgi:hypothetical protein